jgi:ribosome-binding protein aMBF1 (putative translation factor)
MDHQDWRTITFTKTKARGDALARLYSHVTHSESRDHKLDRDERLEEKQTDKDIRKLIQTARIAKKMTQQQLATATNVKLSEIVQLENGTQKTPSPSLVAKLKNVLGISFKLHR